MDDQQKTAPLVSDNAANQDALDFSPYTNTLLDIIRDPHTQGPLTIGVFGTWGSGKTSLMQFVRNDLSDKQKNDGRRFRLAWFDAWKYEKEEALWRALLLRVVDNLRERDAEGNDKTQDPLKTAIERLEQRLYRDLEWEEKGGMTVDWPKLASGAATGAVQLSFSLVPGLSTFVKAVEAAQGAVGKGEHAKGLLEAFQRDVIEHHQAQLRSIEQFQKEFGELVSQYIVKNNERLVVFVDDLDRCLPDKAIEVLEAIKLFLDVPGCIFLLGLDQDVVTRGIKVKYRGFAVDDGTGGEKKIPIDGGQYLEKIIQLPFRLPKIEPKDMQPFIESLAVLPDKRCAQVFAEGLETNPRKVKRAVNVFLFLSRLAEKRELNLQPIRLAKIVVIYHSYPELYDELRKQPILLRDLEEYLRQQATASRDAQREPGGVAKPEMAEQKVQMVAPVQSRVPDALKNVLLLFSDVDEACFRKATYDEINSYFTLTRGTIVEPPLIVVMPTATKGEPRVDFPVPSFITIPEGEFLMGTSDQEIEYLLKTTKWAKEWKEKGYFKPEQPQHQAQLDRFQIAKYPVTNAQYQAFVQDTKRQPPSHWSGGTFAEELAAHPVVNISWNDATEYCKWLSEKLGMSIRLPTEAEWEKAASWDEAKKAKRIYPWDNEWDGAKCNSAESKIGTTTPVGKYSPQGDSPYGIADMAGNVLEWCADWYGENYYQNSPEKNPLGPDSEKYRVLRGGAFDSVSSYVRAAWRYGLSPNFGNGNVGFRVVAGAS